MADLNRGLAGFGNSLQNLPQLLMQLKSQNMQQNQQGFNNNRLMEMLNLNKEKFAYEKAQNEQANSQAIMAGGGVGMNDVFGGYNVPDQNPMSGYSMGTEQGRPTMQGLQTAPETRVNAKPTTTPKLTGNAATLQWLKDNYGDNEVMKYLYKGNKKDGGDLADYITKKRAGQTKTTTSYDRSGNKVVTKQPFSAYESLAAGDSVRNYDPLSHWFQNAEVTQAPFTQSAEGLNALSFNTNNQDQQKAARLAELRAKAGNQ